MAIDRQAAGISLALQWGEDCTSTQLKEQNMKLRLLSGAAVAFALAAWACGGSANPSSNPVTPTPSGGGGGAASSTIEIVGQAGAQSYSPNPGDAALGVTVAWKNSDSVTHHIVMNDGSLDTGDIAPGQTSSVLTMSTNGGNYHCTIHPTMIGSLKASTGAPPPCQGAYC
jgi:plastocyanin